VAFSRKYAVSRLRVVRKRDRMSCMKPPPAAPFDREEMIDAVSSAINGVSDLAQTITEAETLLPTPCPGWTVRDQVAHVIGLESRLLGRPGPDDHLLPDDLAHVHTDLQRFMELDVDSRRARPWSTVQAEAVDVFSARIAQLNAWDFDRDTIMDSPMGPRPAKVALPLRAFDIWAHEQDLRDALNRPGGMDTVAARNAVARCVASFGHIAKQAGFGDTDAVDVEVIDGPFAFRTSSNPNTTSTATLTMTAANFTRLCFGRSSAKPADVVISGDETLAQRFLATMSITP
jgi:uncharacterized protein (TIGR03083 family)